MPAREVGRPVAQSTAIPPGCCARRNLAAENKAEGTIKIYTEAPLWFAAAHLLPESGKTRWAQVDTQDVQRWVTWLLDGYSEACARQRYRALRQFLWLAAEDAIPDPTARLRAPQNRAGRGGGEAEPPPCPDLPVTSSWNAAAGTWWHSSATISLLPGGQLCAGFGTA